MATANGTTRRHVSGSNDLHLVESGTCDTPSSKRKISFGCFDWTYFLKGKKVRDSTPDTDILTEQNEKPEDCVLEMCVFTPHRAREDKYDDKPGEFVLEVSVSQLDSLKQPEREENTEDCTLKVTPEYLQKIKKYTKKQENWNRRLRNKLMELTKEPLETEKPKPPTTLDVQSIISYRRSLERDNKAMTKQIKKLTNACIPTPDMDKGNIYDDKPDSLKQPEREENTEDWTLKVTPEYLQKIKKYTKKQENWNRRLRNKLMELTKEPLETEKPKPPTTLDVQSIISYRRSLERDNKAMTKQIKKLTNISNTSFFYTSVGCISMSSTVKQAELAEKPEDCRMQI